MTVRSVHHPGGGGRTALAIHAQTRFFGIVLLVVMTIGLTAALQGRPILWPVVWAVLGGYGLASIAAQWWLRETPAEVEIRGALATVRSVWEAAPGARRDESLPVFEVRLQRGELHVSLGDTVRTFRPDDWPDFDTLVAAFRGAAEEMRRSPLPDVPP